MYGILAQTPAQTPADFGVSTGEVIGYLLKVLFVLIIIIGMIVVLIKFLAQKNRTFLGNRAITMLGGVQLGPNKSLQLIEIGHSLYIIGVSERIHLLEKIDDPAEIEHIKNALKLHEPEANLLARLTGRLRMKKPQDHVKSSVSFEEMFAIKMKQVSGQQKKVRDLLADDDRREDRPEEI
jgi:flagellar protein FliO/FliZ